MRCGVGVMFALGFGLGLAQSASAADYWPLRGSTYDAPRQRDWSGFYVGGQAGTGGGGANFDGASNSIVAHMLRDTRLESEATVSNWVTVGRADTGQALQYGLFLGYNFQWDDVVLGIEASYNHTDLNAVDTGGLGRIVTLSDKYQYTVTSTTTAQIALSDFATIRGRAGYAFDRFLPYVTGGVALGRASYWAGATVSYPKPIDTTTGLPGLLPAVSLSDGDGKSNSLIYGWSAGLGMDVALTQNIFLRAEYEYIQFSQMKLNLNNARAGLGFKF
jgi:outer membrane immunogenic protein